MAPAPASDASASPRTAPEIVTSVATLRARLAVARESGRRVGLVPTMGALHDGHLALVHEAKRRAQIVVVSIFVNPTQFGPTEDFSRYPRDLRGDVDKCARAGADLVFAPESPSAIYPSGDECRVRVGVTAHHLEGAFRPSHFEGVATVVAKLFGVIGPSVAVFGCKDYQQLAVIRRMARDLFLPVEVVGHPTVRENDGLAMSSHNAYLSVEDRTRARCISQGLAAASRAFERGERSARALEHAARAEVERGTDAIDYVICADADTVVPLEADARVHDRAVLAIAARVGPTRLIDNVLLGDASDMREVVGRASA